MKRVFQLMKELNLSYSAIKEYFNSLGYIIETQNEKIDPDLVTQIWEIHHNPGLLTVKKIDEDISKIESEIVELPAEFIVHNPFEKEFLEITLTHDLFENRVQKLIVHNDESCQSIFTNIEAFSICNGLDNRNARKIARKYFKNSNDLSDVLEAHQIAMKTIEKYGAKMISFILSLPPLPFKAIDAADAKRIFSHLDKRKKTQEFPILRILYKNREGEAEKIHISYFAEIVDNERVRNDNIIVLRNKTTRKTIMKISRNGLVLPESNSKEIVPVLQFFIQFSQSPKKFILNYGMETGECSICGRTLTDPESIKRHKGPICIQYE